MLLGNTQSRRLIINAFLGSRTPTRHVAQPDQKSTSVSKTNYFLTRPFFLRQNRQVKKGGIVGTLSSEDTWHASCRDTWHASYSDTWHTLSSGSSSSGPSHKTHMARFSGLPQGRSSDTYKHIIRTAYTIHPDDRHIPSGYNGPDH